MVKQIVRGVIESKCKCGIWKAVIEEDVGELCPLLKLCTVNIEINNARLNDLGSHDNNKSKKGVGGKVVIKEFSGGKGYKTKVYIKKVVVPRVTNSKK